MMQWSMDLLLPAPRIFVRWDRVRLLSFSAIFREQEIPDPHLKNVYENVKNDVYKK